MQHVLLLVLVAMVHCLIYNKITTLQPTRLTPNDYLISTMGRFRLTLAPNTCQLQLENFTRLAYSIVGYYPRTALPSCSFAQLQRNSLLSDNNQTLLGMRAPHRQVTFDQAYMTIDEMGIVRLNGVFGSQFVTAQNWISIFRTPQQYVFSISNLNVKSVHSLSFIENRGKWGFSAINGELRVFKVDNVSRITKYNYTAFTITPNNLFDKNSNALPEAYFPGFKYRPLCPSNSFRSFQGPFVFEISPYWPELRLLDRTGYQIIAVRYPGRSCLNDRNVTWLQTNDECFEWFCPEGTFEFEGTCRATCPPPYFHQISQEGTHRCMLNCMEGLIKDISNRICACGTASLKQCPSYTTATPLGCLCPDNRYYSPYNKALGQEDMCVQSCGPYLFGFEEGICVPCPRFCLTCSQSYNSYGYLRCIDCQDGYELKEKFYCVKKCTTTTGEAFSQQRQFQTHLVQQTCLVCSEEHCLLCTNSTSTCSVCVKPYSLYLNRCIVECPRGFISRINEQGNFQCRSVAACDPLSSTTTGINNQSSCFCLSKSRPAYQSSCGSNSSQLCGVSQYFNQATRECLQCPLGCLTCALDASSRVECTSCRPQYNMFVTLFQQSYCERKSILTNCAQTYDQKSQLCSINNLRKEVESSPARNQCRQKQPNCFVCLTGSTVACSICAEGLLLYLGRCFSRCPTQTYPYRFQRVCLPITIHNCLSEEVLSRYWLFELNQQNKRADAYHYMLTVNFQNIDPLNDPKGILFHYDETHSTPIQVSIATSRPHCLRCRRGYGITRSGHCGKCIFPCEECVFATDHSGHCTKCNYFYRLDEESRCVKLGRTEMPCQQGQFRNESLVCQDQCSGFVRENKLLHENNRTYRVNCSLNCPSGMAIFPSGSRLQCSNLGQSGSTQTIQFLGSRVELSESAFFILMSSSTLEYSTAQPIRVQEMVPSASRRLQSSVTAVQSTEMGFIVQSDQPGGALLLYLESGSISADVDGSIVYPGNSVYGFSPDTKSTISLIYDQTYNLYMYGRAYIILTLLVTVVFLSQRISYKTDNLWITFAVIYLTLPSFNLKASQSSLNSYSFIYGFAWSTFLQMLSNPRFITRSTSWFDDGYLQKVPNSAHYLLFVDNNVLRNGWSILLMLIVTISVLGAVILVMKGCSVSKVKSGSKWSRVGKNAIDFDHSQSVGLFLLFCVETSFIGLVYYSFSNLFNEAWVLAPTAANTGFKVMGALLLVVIIGYGVVRFYTNRIGGIYCAKRIILGLVLGATSALGGIDKNTALGIVLLVVSQIAFALLRYKYELLSNPLSAWLCKKKKFQPIEPKTRIRKGHTLSERSPQMGSYATQPRKSSVVPEQPIPEWGAFWTMVVEELLIIVLYIFAGLLPTLEEVSVLLIWVILNVFMVVMALELLELAVEYWDRSVNHHSDSQQGFVRPLRTIWDHSVTLKSLATTQP